jgi:hypothetical protein
MGDADEGTDLSVPQANKKTTARSQYPSLDCHAWTGVLVKSTGAELPLYVDISTPDNDSGRPSENVKKILDSGAPLAVKVGGVECKHGKAVLRRTLLAAIIPSDLLRVGEAEITLHCNDEQLRLATPFGTKTSLPIFVVKDVRSPPIVTDSETGGADTLDMRGNSLASIALAEDHHESFQVIDNGHEVAVLISKTDPADFATVFVFGLKGGKARLDRYETAETNLDNRPKWDFVDTCQLGDVVVSSQGDLTIVQIAEGVEFVFEPRTLKQAYSANLHIGPMVFAAITCVGEQWIQWFSKKWVPSVAMGDPEESGMIERFAAPTISSLTKRNRNASK